LFSAEIIQNLLLGILTLLIPATAAYLKLKLKGQNGLDLLKAENEAKRTEAIYHSATALVSHTETMREVIRVLGETNTSNQVQTEAIGHVIDGHKSLLKDISTLSGDWRGASTAYKDYLKEVQRDMEEYRRFVDTAPERRGENRG
jgi:hypothetical protein